MAPAQDGTPFEQVFPLTYDIRNWGDLDMIGATQRICSAIDQKGFCIIDGFADDKVRRMAEKEARNLKRAGSMKRLSLEACAAHLGDMASSWTMPLEYGAGGEAQELHPADQENLQKIDACLEQVGNALARGGGKACGELLGRTAGTVHFSRMPEDRAPPKLLDPKEAQEYVARASTRKVVLLYYLGPSSTVINFVPLEEIKNTYRMMTKSPVIIAYRNDALQVSLNTKGVGVTVEVNFLTRRLTSQLLAPKDILPVPRILVDWFNERLEAIADNADVPITEIPLDFQKEAALSIHKKVPIRIVETWNEFPSMPKFSGGFAPIEASLLGGQDPVTEICRPRHLCDPADQTMWTWGGKWDPDEYYDPDPAASSDFKMYTRHYAVLNRNHPFEIDFEATDFDINSIEELSLDPRARMLLEGNRNLWKKAGDDYLPKKEDVGIFVGMSGESQYWNFMKRESRINEYAVRNLSNASMVARLPYHFKTTGPAILVDTEDSSGIVALDTACNHLWQERCGPFCFASGVQWIGNPFETILQCAAGFIAKSSRTRVWDETADGFTKAEGIATFCLERHDRVKVKKQTAFSFLTASNVDENADPFRCLIVGSGLNSKGQSSSLTAPSAAAFLDCAKRASDQAKKPFSVVDAFEANANGNRLADIVELGFLRKLITVEERGVQAVTCRPARATYGSAGPVNGLISVARCTYLFQSALHGPMIHLRQMMDIGALQEDGGERMLYLTEAVEARTYNQLVGVSSFGAAGTNCQMMLWGQKLTVTQAPRPPKPLTWWPNAPVPTNVRGPLKGYYIVGTWNAWTEPIKMEKEADGTWGFTLTMGENNWECFHVLQDHDPDLCLHPPSYRSPRDTKVEGPDKSGKELCWYISGSSDFVRLINEKQAERLRNDYDAALERGEQPPEPEERYVVAFAEDEKPQGHEHAQEPSEMPLVNLNEDMAGRPGDRYRIRLHLRGKYTRLDWTKYDGPVEATEVETPYEHKYCIIGDHSYWTFQDMEPLEGKEGLYGIEVQLLREKSNFQIYRDRDWEQGFHPPQATDSAEADIQGPDELGHGKNWQITGKPGDRFRVEFLRKFVKGEDQKTLRWEFIEHGTVNFQEIISTHRYCYVSSGSGFRRIIEMAPNEKRTRFSHQIRLGKTGVEYFQIILNGNWLAAVHPSTNEATQYDEGVTVQGPDDAGADKYWAIGLHKKDKDKLGAREWVSVHMELKDGMPHKVWWERYESMDAHNERLAWGCQQIFQRHCRMLGFIPWRSNDRPAQVVGRPTFLTADSNGVAGTPTMPLSALAEDEDSEEEDAEKQLALEDGEEQGQ